VCRKFAELFEAGGGQVFLSTIVKRIHANDSGANLETSQGTISARLIVNCAGLQSERVAKMAGSDSGARIVPFRGGYYELKPESPDLVRNLIHPVPDPQFPFSEFISRE
jgi:L-2-hydroxyglutarate oxidase